MWVTSLFLHTSQSSPTHEKVLCYWPVELQKMKSVGSRQYYFSFSSLSWLTNMKLLYLDSASVHVAHHSLRENVYQRELQSDSCWSKERSCNGCLNSVLIHIVCLLERAGFGSVVCGVFTELAPTYS